MGKPRAKSDTHCRINFLYQVSTTLLKTCKQQHKTAKYFGNLISSVSKKNQAKLLSELKRAKCKCCHTVLQFGHTARVRYRSKGRKRKHIIVTCHECGVSKRYPNNQQWKTKLEGTSTLKNV